MVRIEAPDIDMREKNPEIYDYLYQLAERLELMENQLEELAGGKGA